MDYPVLLYQRLWLRTFLHNTIHLGLLGLYLFFLSLFLLGLYWISPLLGQVPPWTWGHLLFLLLLVEFVLIYFDRPQFWNRPIPRPFLFTSLKLLVLLFLLPFVLTYHRLVFFGAKRRRYACWILEYLGSQQGKAHIGNLIQTLYEREKEAQPQVPQEKLWNQFSKDLAKTIAALSSLKLVGQITFAQQGKNQLMVFLTPEGAAFLQGENFSAR